ncbi:hypothetical protein SpCBS45565_g08072 [Spizellomyces sp. 'palustris']|nr:hypothetical protein SpCBS45565_g08072 [Spizellomyces sp. 'palustris']
MPSRYIPNPYLHKNLQSSNDQGLTPNQKQTFQQAIATGSAQIHAHYSASDVDRADVYTGICGAALVLWKVGNSSSDELAARLVEMTSSKVTSRHHVGFICGEAGLWAVSALLVPDLRKRALQQIELAGKEANSNPREWNEVLYGRAGYLYGLLFLSHHRILPSTFPLARLLTQTVNTTLSACESRRPYVWSWHNKHYLGAAHGVGGILCMILRASQVEGVCVDLKGVKKTLEWVASEVVNRQGGWPVALNEERELKELVQWCHGPPGAVLCLCRAYEVFGDQLFLDAAKLAADVVWEKGLLRKGVGLCHGISGNAYVFLHLYLLTNERLFWDRAVKFAEFILQWEDLTRRHVLLVPDHPWSLFEGLGGAVMLWNDILEISSEGGGESVGFPAFMDV